VIHAGVGKVAVHHSAQKKMRSYENCPVAIKFAFLLTSTYRSAFHPLRDFHPLSCQKTVFNHFASSIKEAETQV
jgi:hypothetical protein